MGAQHLLQAAPRLRLEPLWVRGKEREAKLSENSIVVVCPMGKEELVLEREVSLRH